MSGRPTFSLTQLAIAMAFARIWQLKRLPPCVLNFSGDSVIAKPAVISGTGISALAAAIPQRMCAMAGTLAFSACSGERM